MPGSFAARFAISRSAAFSSSSASKRVRDSSRRAISPSSAAFSSSSARLPESAPLSVTSAVAPFASAQNAPPPSRAYPRTTPPESLSMPKMDPATISTAMNAAKSGGSFCGYKFFIVLNQGLAVFLHVVENDRRAAHDGRHRIRRDDDGNAQRRGEEFRESPDEGPAPDKIDAALHHVGDNFRRRRFQHFLH